ncbi:hypothetical protein LCGC14_0738570 [marine sediment metagenome]|uniref:dTDP-4-dehydrorhamnose reductase n=2 Tax=root TaxID=1 RepID=A0A831QNL7_9FLAO|nr:dTDP-4-dehydrorhamnose reductase [Pricia antarctica]
MKKILVTGGKGQLAMCIKEISLSLNDFEFLFVDIDELDITDSGEVMSFFGKNDISYCVNCAAFTAVDKAETDMGPAERVNVLGAKNLAQACKENQVKLIQISTDFVFDGLQSTPYTEEDATAPVSVYGRTKLDGELIISATLGEHIIIRTSWLYSEHGSNFLITMLRLGSEKEELGVVCDQIGTPTYAGDLASLILKIILGNEKNYGTYHYSNEGVASWYDFAVAIFDIGKIKCKVLPIKTSEYPTPARRPAFSVMDTSKIKNVLGLKIPYWRDSVSKAIQILKNSQ